MTSLASVAEFLVSLLGRLDAAAAGGAPMRVAAAEAEAIAALLDHLGRRVDREVLAEREGLLRRIAAAEGRSPVTPPIPAELHPAMTTMTFCFDAAARAETGVTIGPEAAAALARFLREIARLVQRTWPAERARLEAAARRAEARAARLAQAGRDLARLRTDVPH